MLHNLAMVLTAPTTPLLFFWDFHWGAPGKWALLMLPADMVSVATARHSGFTVQMDSTPCMHISCAWNASDSQCQSPSTGCMAHMLRMTLVKNKLITATAGSMQARLGCPSRAQLELDMQSATVWLYTAQDSPLKPD